jgi:ubiquinone/menaquinone biosynthesis C-methylase UbiE
MIENANSITDRLIKDSGIVEGMRVLDVGCGNGEVSLLLANAVGSNGEVVGIDRNEAALSIARDRAKSENVSNVSFLAVDISNSLSEIGIYDAVVGRRVLMYLPNPIDVLRNISGVLKENGIVAFQEIDSTVTPGRTEPLPLHEKVNKWIWRTIEKEGANINMGFALPSVLQQSGFVVENIMAEANIQGQKTHHPLAKVVRAILHRIVEHGVATKTEIEIETLEQRLNDERSDSSVFISELSFSIWARKISV